MPQAAERLGAVTEMLPLGKLAAAIQRAVRQVQHDRSRALETVVDRVAELLLQRIGLRPDPTLRGRLRRAIRDEMGDRAAETPQRTSTAVADGGALSKGC